MPASRHTLQDLAALVGGQVFGDPELVVTGVADPPTAASGDLLFLLDAKYREAVALSAGSAVVLKAADPTLDKPQIVCANPRLAMARLMALFVAAPPAWGHHPTAVVAGSALVHPTALLGPHVVVGENSRVGADCVLHPGVVVGRDVEVGPGCLLYPHVVLYDGVSLGARVILHAGTVVGSDGYGFTPDETGKHLKVPQMGNVILGDDVECGAHVAIDRGTFGPTVIGRGTKLDNLVHVGHNDRIGEDCLIVSQTGLSGSVTVGDRVTLAGQVGVAGHLTIGSGTTVLARAGVTKDIPPKSLVSGFPARPHREELRRLAALAQVERLITELAQVKAALASHSDSHPMEEQPYDR